MKIYNVWNVYGTIIATGAFLACLNHIIVLLNEGYGEWDDYKILPVNELYLPWE